jgi:alpha-acetolactate decarboxylase
MGLFGIGNKPQQKSAFEQRVDRGKQKYPLIPRWIIKQSFKQIEKQEKPKQTFQQPQAETVTETQATYTEENKNGI